MGATDQHTQSHEQLRVIFMGTPEFSAHILHALLPTMFRPIAVYTNPDRPVGRKHVVIPSPIKEIALKEQIPVYQPERMRDSHAIEQLAGLKPDLIIVASFGHILPRAIIDLPRYGCINVHASLLPELRGPSPIHASIIQGKHETGITIMKMAFALDAGDILAQEKTALEARETYTTLHHRLAEIGARLLVETLPRWIAGSIIPEKQDERNVTYTKILTKEDGKIDWTRTADVIDRQVRALMVWPQTYSFYSEEFFATSSSSPSSVSRMSRIKIIEAEVVSLPSSLDLTTPGKIMFYGDELFIVCGNQTCLFIRQLQLEGKQIISGKDFIRGHRQFAGIVLR